MADRVYPVRPVRVTASMPIPPDELFTFISDTRNDLVWCPNVESVELLEGMPAALGSRYRFRQHLDQPGGKRLQFTGETEILALGTSSITWSVTDRFQERLIEMAVEPEGEGSRVTQTTRASFHRPPGVARYLYPLMAKRIFRAQFDQLAAYLVARQ